MCGKRFYRNKSKQKLSKSGLFFCNRKCKEKAQTIEGGCKEIQPYHYKDGIYCTYRVNALKYYGENCQECGYNKFPQILQVHHIDRNRNNNLLENLQVLCPNCHAIKHRVN